MGHPATASVDLEPRLAARAAGLVYVQDDQPGYHRRRCGRGFRYTNPAGKRVRDRHIRRRIAALAIPPAWKSVWICLHDNGHLQATGLDARGRKQYRYHADWRAIRDTTKYHRLAQFGTALPAVRRRIRRDLKLRGLPRDKVVAAVMRLLDVAGIRVGNQEYAESNKSFGLTTLQDRHARVRGLRLQLRFRGKGGLPHQVEIDDSRLARIVRRCSELPGQRLFQFLDDDGEEHPIESTDVNATIQQWTGTDFTAKDFRTWTGSVSFLQAACEDASTSLNDALQRVAHTLGNTPAICRKHYIHPLLVEHFVDGSLQRRIRRMKRMTTPRELDATERLLLKLLKSAQIVTSAKTAHRRLSTDSHVS